MWSARLLWVQLAYEIRYLITVYCYCADSRKMKHIHFIFYSYHLNPAQTLFCLFETHLPTCKLLSTPKFTTTQQHKQPLRVLLLEKAAITRCLQEILLFRKHPCNYFLCCAVLSSFINILIKLATIIKTSIHGTFCKYIYKSII